MPTCACIVPHPTELRVLLFREEGGWSLPSVEYPGGWIAEQAGSIARRLGAQLGLELTALRHLQSGPPELCELENHSPGGPPQASARWVSREELAALPRVVPAHRAALERWFADTQAGANPSCRAPWERPGWFAEATEWIQSQLPRLGCAATGPIEQRKAVWGFSCLLRVPTSCGDLYFKAVYARPPSEPALISAMAEQWPQNLPEIVAMDADRRWMLMRDFGGRSLEAMPIDDCEQAVRRFAQIQIESATSLDRWLSLGCRDLRPDRLPGHIDALLADTAALRLGQPDGLAVSEMEEIHALSPRLKELCVELSRSGLPATLVQQDFRAGNVVVQEENVVFYDWSDTVVAHPFFSACRFLNYILTGDREEPGPRPEALSAREQRRRVRDAYLELWTAYQPMEQLLHAFRLARQLNAAYLAIRWHLELPHLEPESPCGRDVASAIPGQLRDVLGGMALLHQHGRWLMDIKEEGSEASIASPEMRE